MHLWNIFCVEMRDFWFTYLQSGREPKQRRQRHGSKAAVQVEKSEEACKYGSLLHTWHLSGFFCFLLAWATKTGITCLTLVSKVSPSIKTIKHTQKKSTSHVKLQFHKKEQISQVLVHHYMIEKLTVYIYPYEYNFRKNA